MQLKKTRKVATVAATMLLTITAVTAMAVANSGVATADEHHGAAARWNSGSAKPARAGDVELLEKLAASFDKSRPAADGASRSIDVGVTTRIGVVPTTSGTLCYLVEERARTTYQACGEDFAPDGTAAAYTTGAGDPISLIGLVADDVTSVSLVTDDGATHEVRIIDGAIAWYAPADVRIVSLTTVRAGERHVETDRFGSLRS